MQTAKIWRWTALFSVLLNVGFNYLYASDGTMTTVTDSFRTVFRPAGYAFSIWGIIYLSWIVFCIYELLPKQLDNPSLEHLSKPVIVSSVISICWLFAFTNSYISISFILIVAMLCVAILQLRNAHRIVEGSSVNKWLVLVPFSLYAAWLSVATIANTFIWVNARGWAGSMAQEQVWGVVLVAAAGVIGATASLQLRNPFFSLVVAWASVALWVEQGSTFVLFGSTCIIVAVVMIMTSIYEFSKRWPERKVVL